MKKLKKNQMVILFTTLMVLSGGAWSDSEEDAILEKKRVDANIQEKNLEDARVQQQQLDRQLEDRRLEQKRVDNAIQDRRLDDQRWERSHGRL